MKQNKIVGKWTQFTSYSPLDVRMCDAIRPKMYFGASTISHFSFVK